MTEVKGCFLLVSVGRPCVSLPTSDGGGEIWRNGEIEQESAVRRHEGKAADRD